VKTNVIVMTTRSATVLFIAAPPDRALEDLSSDGGRLPDIQARRS
jgi:hypothetical protein